MKSFLIPVFSLLFAAGCSKSSIAPNPIPSSTGKDDLHASVGPQISCSIQTDRSTAQIIYNIQATVSDSSGTITSASWQYQDISGNWNTLPACSIEYKYAGPLPAFSQLKFTVKDNVGYQAWFVWSGAGTGIYGN
jgi:hypothetical protein